MTDIEIAKSIEKEEITKIAKKLGIDTDDLELFGKYKAKISNDVYEKNKQNKNGKLILVTAITPTKLGEGKTTVSIAIGDALQKINKKTILALREPSLGPVFGIKGGATGGGRAQIVPMEDINLHFTGDMHAITAANNLLSSIIDNHIYFGNELNIKEVVWSRCLDLNDRQLRIVQTGLSNEKNTMPRKDTFCITAASEIMAILCLAKNLNDLKERLGNILIGYNKDDEPIYAKDLKVNGSMAVLLKDAIKPNLVQTLEHTPVIVHGGPFANIAHGCNSLIATKTALKLSDYVVTEAGFGSDLGAEKFIDIKCRKSGLKPDVTVLVVTIKAINNNGKEEGIKNLYKHIENLKDQFGLNVIVALNKYETDSKEDIEYIIDKIKQKGVEVSIVEGFKKGSQGAIEIANKIVDLAERESDFKYIYEDNDKIEEKIYKVATKIYGASNIEYSDEAKEEIKKIENMGYANLPICIAKSQYYLTGDINETLNIRNVKLNSGAGFIVIYAGEIMTMPGLPKKPAAEEIDINNDEEIIGIF